MFDPASAGVDQVLAEVERRASFGSVADARSLVSSARTRFPGDPRLLRWAEVLAPPFVWIPAPEGPAATASELRACLAQEGRRHLGQWVVIAKGHVVASGDSLDAVRATLMATPGAAALPVNEASLGG